MQQAINLVRDRLMLLLVADPPNFQLKAIVFISRLQPVATILKQIVLVVLLLVVQVNGVLSLFDEFQFWFCDFTVIILVEFLKRQFLKFLPVAALDLNRLYYVMKYFRLVLKSPKRLSIFPKLTSSVNLWANEKINDFWTAQGEI